MKCDIRSYPSVGGCVQQVFRCIVHDWTVLVPVCEGYQCPVGRMEALHKQAVDLVKEVRDAQ